MHREACRLLAAWQGIAWGKEVAEMGWTHCNHSWITTAHHSWTPTKLDGQCPSQLDTLLTTAGHPSACHSWITTAHHSWTSHHPSQLDNNCPSHLDTSSLLDTHS